MAKKKGGVDAALRKLSEANTRDRQTAATLKRGERMQEEEEKSEGQKRKQMKPATYSRGGSVCRGMGAAKRGGGYKN